MKNVVKSDNVSPLDQRVFYQYIYCSRWYFNWLLMCLVGVMTNGPHA